MCWNLIAIQLNVTKLLSKNLLTRVMKCIVVFCVYYGQTLPPTAVHWATPLAWMCGCNEWLLILNLPLSCSCHTPLRTNQGTVGYSRVLPHAPQNKSRYSRILESFILGTSYSELFHMKLINCFPNLYLNLADFYEMCYVSRT